MGWFKIGDLFTLQMGKTPARSNSSFWGNGHIWVSISDLSNCNKYIASSRELITDDAVQESGIRIVPQGTLIMSFKLSLGKTAITASNLYTNEAIMAFIDKKIVPLDINYVYHLFNNWDWSRATNKAVMGLTLNKATLSQIKIPIPSLNTQKAIANILDKIDESITLRKRQLEIFNQLVKSRFIEMFGDPQSNCYNWKIVPLKDVMVGGALNGYFTKPQNYDIEGNVGVICVSDVVNRKYTNVNALRRAFASEKDLQKYCVKYGDMLFCRSSLVKEGIGKASIIPPHTENDILFECHVIKITLDMSRVIPEYLQALSITDFFRIQVIRQSKTATMTTIGQKDIASVNILLPPMELQKRFTEFSAQIDKSKLAVQKSLDELEILKKSLMQTYFG